MEFRIVSGLRKGDSLLTSGDGYYFYSKHTNKTKTDFRCYKYNCLGRVYALVGSNVPQNNEDLPVHNHDPEPLLESVNCLRDRIMKRVEIAKITVKIRNLQVHMEQFSNDKVNKTKLKEAIDKRNQMLNRLKHADYKKFEWLLDKLDLEHKVYKFGTHERVERKKSLRRLTILYIEKVKSMRLEEYRDFLESQKEGFLKEKLEKLLWMRETEEKCGAPPTVTDADIDTVRRQLQGLQVVKPKEIVE